uniref:Centrosomal protein of 152 kDa-like n=1 Tax=Saccoglossus kowalevskii TaxID=10224 RepID=A0ABM0MI36_SACKO|nr:PREDICTED: centrosomal protein of 152 kDa-like [Saccoglossus kowalevskii]
MMNPGTSINFDGQALEEQQEAEFEREDREREKELRELLSAALPDDLLDDTVSLSSQESSLISVNPSPSPKTISNDHWAKQQQKAAVWHADQVASHNSSLQCQQTSTPLNGNSPPPPLETPASQYNEKQYDHNGYQKENGYGNGYEQNYEFVDGHNRQYEQQQYTQQQQQQGGVYPQQNGYPGVNGHSQESDGYAENNHSHSNGYQEGNGWSNQNNNYQNGDAAYAQNGGHTPTEEYPNDHGEYHHVGNSSDDAYNGYYDEQNGYNHQQQYPENGYHANAREGAYLEGYAEQHGSNEFIDYNGMPNEEQPNEAHDPNAYHYNEYNGKAVEDQSESFPNGYHNGGFHAKVSPQLRSSMPELNKMTDVENYKVQFRANVMNGHSENAEQFITAAPSKMMMQGKTGEEFDSLQKEFLNTDFILQLKMLKVFGVSYNRTDFIEVNNNLKIELSDVKKNSERSQIDYTETINKLTRNLEESQRQCRGLLETGSVQEIGQLKIQLQQANTSKSISEGMYQALQDEVSDLKEQIQMYESAATLGVYSGNGVVQQEGLSDSFAHLGIKSKECNKEWKTPKLHTLDKTDNMSHDDVVNGLKCELERALSTIRSKRGQVTRQQDELKSMKSEHQEYKNRAEHAEKLAKDFVLKEAMLVEKDEALEKLKQSLADSHRVEMMSAKEKWQKDQEPETDRLIETKIAVAKLEWLKEQSDVRKQAVDNALQAAEREWAIKLDMAVDEGIEKRLQEMKGQGFEPEELKKALSVEREKLHQVYEEEKSKAVESAIAIAEVEWMTKHQIDANQKLTAALDDARKAWMKEHDDSVAKITEETMRNKEKLMQEMEDRVKCAVMETENRCKKEQEDAVEQAKLKWKNASDRDSVLIDRALKAAEERVMVEQGEDIRMRIEAAVNDAKAEWMKDGELSMKSRIDDALRKSKSEWQQQNIESMSSKIKEALKEARQKWQEQQKMTIEKVIADTKENMWKEVKSTSSDVMKQTINDLQKEIRQLHDQQEEMTLRQIAGGGENLRKKEKLIVEEKEKDKKDAIKKMQERCDADYSVYLEEHKDTLRKSLKRSREEFEKEKKDNEIKSIIADKEKKWKSDYNSFLDKHRSILDESLDSARKDWQKEVQELKRKHKSEIELIKKGYEERRKSLDKQYEDKLKRLKEDLNKSFDAKVKGSCDEFIKKREKQWQGERLELLKQLQEAEQELKEVEKQFQNEMQELKYKLEAEQSMVHSMESYEKEKSELKQKLDRAESELQVVDENLRLELNHLKSTLDKEHKSNVRRLEAKLAEQERNHTQTVDALKEQLLKAQQVVDRLEAKEKGQTKEHTSTQQTDGEDISEIQGDGLQQLREHYIEAVNKIRSDVIHYINESRDRCAETVRSEVIKERHSTAKKLRKYYLQCLHQLLEDEKKNSDGDNDFDNVTAAQKLALMAKALEVTPENILDKRKPAIKNKISSAKSTGSDRSSRSSSANSSRSSGSSKTDGTSKAKPIVRRRNLSQEFDKFDTEKRSKSTDRSSDKKMQSQSSNSQTLKSVKALPTYMPKDYSKICSSDGKNDKSLEIYASDASADKENIQYSPLTKPHIEVTDKPIMRPYGPAKENSVSSLLEKYKVDPVSGNVSISETARQSDERLRSRYDEVMSLPREPREFNPMPEKLTPDSTKSSPEDPRNLSSSSITLRPRSTSRTDAIGRSASRLSSPADVIYRSGRSRDRLAPTVRSSSSDASVSARSRNTPSSQRITRSRDTSPCRTRDTPRYTASQLGTPVTHSRTPTDPTMLSSNNSTDPTKNSNYLIRPIRDQSGPPDGQSSNLRQPLRVSNRIYNEKTSQAQPKMQKPIPLMTRHTQAPSPAPTNLSFISMDTEYNELPAQLDTSGTYESTEKSRLPYNQLAQPATSTPFSRISPTGQSSRIQSLPSKPQISTSKLSEGRLSDTSISSSTRSYSLHSTQLITPTKTIL